MKQGIADPDGAAGRKREPIPHAVSPGKVDQMGNNEGVPVKNVYTGRGFEGPKPQRETSRNGGSQGQY